ncbi:uncharacterized protein LOC114519791 [Dendronephthya gigantea]|uniref:uncharacterized protein LOC114519791 n=1 Tax=Dendronephthya gigantea TaxID=151771 RepID=UPI00106D77D3|nr:uncharacterized protein LOC114519791 [Dendronephthya gigantea]
MPFCRTTSTWATNIATEDEGRRQYVVQLKRDVNCCEDKYKLFVDNEEKENDLTDNPCSPLCCKGGSYQWQDHGHEFNLVYNALSLTGVVGKHRLFIDDVDCNTGREFGEFFRRRGYQFIVFGFLILLAGVIWASIFRFIIHSSSVSVVGYAFIIAGLIWMITGIIPVLRYRNSRPAYSRPVHFDAEGPKDEGVLDL